MTSINESKKILTQEITDWLKKELKTCDDPVVQKIFGIKDWKVNDYFFNDGSLRLRAAGCQLLKIWFDHEEFVHERPFYTGEILILAEKMNAPFFINQEKIILFHHEHIVMCKLAGSVALWLKNIS